MALTQVSTGGIKDGQVQTADLADGQVTVGKLHADALDHTYTLGADGSNHYTFTGEGLTGAVNDPTLYLTRGKTYRFVNGNSAGAHPFRIQTTVNGSAGTEYNTGVTNNGGAGGSTIVFEVPHDAPDVLYYQCTSHGSMGGILYVTGALADGTVTTAKIADSNVTTAKIADEAVTLAKLPHGTSSNNGKFLRANNGADPTFETVSTDLVGDTSPQLGGHLESNGYDIKIADGDEIKVGTGNDLLIYHSNNQSYVQDNGVGDLTVASNSNIKLMAGDENSVVCNDDGSVELYHDNTKVFETGANRIFAKARFNINADGINSGHDLGFGQWDGSNHRIEGDSNRPMFITSYNSSGIKFGASSAVKATVTSNGLTFNGDTAAANALDDYEEGTWTPAFTQGYAYVSTITYSQQVGHYTKIGNQVFAYAYMRMTGNSSHSGNIITDGNILLIGGLPYTALNAAYTDGGGYLTYTDGIFGTNVSSENFHTMPWVGGNGTSVSFHKPSSGGNIVGSDTNPTNKYLIFHVRYRTS